MIGHGCKEGKRLAGVPELAGGIPQCFHDPLLSGFRHSCEPGHSLRLRCTHQADCQWATLRDRISHRGQRQAGRRCAPGLSYLQTRRTLLLQHTQPSCCCSVMSSGDTCCRCSLRHSRGWSQLGQRAGAGVPACVTSPCLPHKRCQTCRHAVTKRKRLPTRARAVRAKLSWRTPLWLVQCEQEAGNALCRQGTRHREDMTN